MTKAHNPRDYELLSTIYWQAWGGLVIILHPLGPTICRILYMTKSLQD